MTELAPSALMDHPIAELADGRGGTLIHQAIPTAVEETKWLGVPVWPCPGIECTGEVHRALVELTFLQRAKLAGLRCFFNASLDGNTRCAIRRCESSALDRKSFRPIEASVAPSKSPGESRSRRQKPLS